MKCRKASKNKYFVGEISLNLKSIKLMLFSAFVALLLVSCGGGSGSNSTISTNTISLKPHNGIAQKGPFSIDSNITITKLDTFGASTDVVIQAKVSSKSGGFSYETDESDTGAYYLLEAKGSFFDEELGSFSENEIKLSAITSSLKNSSINVITHWLTQRIDTLLASDKNLKNAFDQSQIELSKLFGINNSNSLDITSNLISSEKDNALLLLLSGALMEASSSYDVSSQIIIDEIGADFADDGLLNDKGDSWFIRLQSLIKGNPQIHAKKYAKSIRDMLGYNISLDEKLPVIIPLASRPVANVPSELLAEPSETITLDGSGSHDSGDIINFTWFRVDQQTQYDVQVSDRFLATPTITVPDEETVLSAPNQEISLLYALVVTDADKLTHTGVVKVTIRIPPPLNNPPIADSQSLITDEDTPIAITLSSSDPDGDIINFVLSTPFATSNGILELDPAQGASLPNIIYNPTPNFFGSDNFTFIVNDGFANSNTATVEIQVNPVNDVPEANSQSVSTNEGQTIDITLTGFDADTDPLTFSIETMPQNGLITGTPPNITYTPSQNYNGSDSFTFVVNDGLVDSNTATVSIQVNSVNNLPVANPQSLTINEDQAIDIVLTGSDVDTDLLTFSIETMPQDGVITGTPPNITYTPTQNYNGSDSFTFMVNDSFADSNTAAVNIQIDPVNDRPIADAGPNQTIPFDRIDLSADFIEFTQAITLDGSNSSDTEDLTPSLTFNWTFVSGPTFINLGNPVSLFITPDDLIMTDISIRTENESIEGDYVFNLVVTDSGALASDPDEVIITVAPNQPPTAKDISRPIDPTGLPTSITLMGEDPEGGNLIYEIVELPSDGNLLDNINQTIGIGQVFDIDIRYQSDFSSPTDPDSFTYKVIDELGAESNIATVNLTEPNTPPRANAGFNRSVPIAETATPTSILQTATINLDGTRSSDIEDASIDLIYKWTQISGPITIPSGDIPQVREPSFEIINTDISQTLSGVYQFELQVTDSGGLVSAIDEVSIGASLPNSLVIAIPGEDRDIIELTTVQVVGSGSTQKGIDNSLLVHEWKQIDIIPGSEIDLVFDPSYERYTPTFVAPAVTVATVIKIQLILRDTEFGFSEPEVVTFTVFPTGTVIANDPPTAVDQNISIYANGSSALFELRGMGDDPDGDNLGLTYEIIGFNDPGQGLNDPSQGSIRSQTINFVYTPVYSPTNPVVENSLTYVAIDQDGAKSDPATITFTPIVSPPGNTAPVAQDITINIDGPPTSSNSRQLLSYAIMVQDPDDDNYLINEIDKSDLEVRFQLITSDLRMDNRNRTSAGSGTFQYQAIDIYGNSSNTATITINYND